MKSIADQLLLLAEMNRCGQTTYVNGQLAVLANAMNFLGLMMCRAKNVGISKDPFDRFAAAYQAIDQISILIEEEFTESTVLDIALAAADAAYACMMIADLYGMPTPEQLMRPRTEGSDS